MRTLHTCCRKRISTGEFPHASKELSEASAESCHANDDIGRVDRVSSSIVEREDESRGGEREETAVNVLQWRVSDGSVRCCWNGTHSVAGFARLHGQELIFVSLLRSKTKADSKMSSIAS
jgi:hypothetical protein